MGRLAAFLLIVINAGFIGAGLALINFATTLTNTGWIDTLEKTDYKSAASTFIFVAMCVGGGTITVALVGLVGALCRSRILLFFYSLVIFVAMIAFGAIACLSFLFTSKMKIWAKNEYPASSTESDFAPTFNEVYCYAQGSYFCGNASTAEIKSIFLPNVSADIASALPKANGINSLCTNGQIASIAGTESVCKACNESKKYDKFERILKLIDEKCPRTTMTSTYCAGYLQTGKGEVYVNSPWKQCRKNVLDVAVSWGNFVTIVGAMAFVAALLLLGLSCSACRRSRSSADRAYSKRYRV